MNEDKLKETIERIMLFFPVGFVIAGALGYLALLEDDMGILGRWSIGILAVLSVLNIAMMIAVIVLDHKKRKEGKNGKE